MNPALPIAAFAPSAQTRRAFMQRGAFGFGALGFLQAAGALSGAATPALPSGVMKVFHVPPRAKRVIFLFMGGGPSQFETFDPKPKLNKLWGKPMPDSLTKGERVAQLQGSPLGTFAANCLLARRLAERGVRFIQLYHRGWDQHAELPSHIRMQCKGTDQPSAGLVTDLKRRGLLDDTLIVWGGEFGRTVYCQGKLTETDYGRDHHPRNFAWWLAGGGIKPGISMGSTDDFSYNIEEEGVHVHDMQATIMHCLGVDHTKLTYKFQGRWFRLTDVHGNVVRKLLS